MGKLAFRYLPSSQFCSDPCAVFLKLSLTLEPRNHERRRNLRQAGRTDRVIQWRRACTLTETSKEFFYAHLCQPERINDPARKASLQIEARLVEIVVRVPHVRILGLVTDFRRKFRVTPKDVRNVRR